MAVLTKNQSTDLTEEELRRIKTNGSSFKTYCRKKANQTKLKKKLVSVTIGDTSVMLKKLIKKSISSWMEIHNTYDNCIV